jgi:tetraacyldisaccharide 4'-kinase
MILLRILLFPFAWLYYVVTQIRNRLYEQGLKPSVTFDIPVVSVGNLSIGGTGKTPMIEYLIRLLQDKYKIATLSRGYGRQTKGIRIADPGDDALSIGDEPFQFYKKFGKHITVSVGEERALAIPLILQDRPETQVILLDDAFQHRQVVPRFSILLTDYSRPFYDDYLLPSGRLRESRHSAGRADVIVVTKCPDDISGRELQDIEKSIERYAGKPVFFTRIRYGSPMPFSNTTNNISQKFVLITAVANSKPLESYVGRTYSLLKHFDYRDHHYYTEGEIKSWLAVSNNSPEVCFLTTEKDRVKLDAPEFQHLISGRPFFYLPIEVAFIKDGKDFDELVLNIVKNG